MKVLVCNECRTDYIGACDQIEAEQGYDAFCFECEKLVDTVEITLLETTPSKMAKEMGLKSGH
jgi:hypothetical protein